MRKLLIAAAATAFATAAVAQMPPYSQLDTNTDGLISPEEAKAMIPHEVFHVTLVEEGYRGYNILHIGVDKFLALAQREGAYVPEKLAAGGYAQAHVASSPKEAKRAVKRGLSK